MHTAYSLHPLSLKERERALGPLERENTKRVATPRLHQRNKRYIIYIHLHLQWACPVSKIESKLSLSLFFSLPQHEPEPPPIPPGPADSDSFSEGEVR